MDFLAVLVDFFEVLVVLVVDLSVREGCSGETEDESEAEGDACDFLHCINFSLKFSTTDSSSEDHSGSHMNHPLRPD